MSLVAVLLLGMTGVSYWSARSARTEQAQAARDQSAGAVQVLAWMLSRLDAHDIRIQQAALRTFALHRRCEKLRVYDASGLVVASINAKEIGRRGRGDGGGPMPTPTTCETHDLPRRGAETDRWMVTAPVAHPTASADGTDPPARFVQCVLSPRPTAGRESQRAGVAAIVLMAVGTFLVVYRLMRRHFRAMSRISENLLLRGDQLEQDLASLRLMDGEGALASQWNRLIDLVDDLSSSARRATASVELKAALERSRGGELEELINAIPDGLLHVTDHNRLEYANATARRVMMLPADGSHGSEAGSQAADTSLEALEVGPTGREIIEQIRAARDADGSFRSQSTVVEADGGASSYRVRVHPLNKSKRRGECVITIADISQQVRSDRAAEEFVSQVTHELRTPLTNIRAYAETLSSGVFDDPAVITDCYNVITKETRRLSRLIEDILSMSQLEVGSLQLRVDDVDLKTLVTDGVRDLRGLADEKRVDMQVSLPSKLPTLQADRDKLAVVLNNLLGNALKYTPSGGSVQVGCQASDEAILITVKDTGIGIDPADHDRIFEKFQRGSSQEVEGITGTGIGLTTAREIVRRHGGDIEVMSAKDAGSTFVVRLPLKTSQMRQHASAS